MGDKSGIQWTDATWNPVTGCDKVSPGCANCYAETVALRFWGKQYPAVIDNWQTGASHPRKFEDVWCHDDRLDQPLRWKRPRRIFVNSMSDLFQKDVPDEFIDKVFAVMALAPRHTFQVLTKRAERMRDYMSRTKGADGVICRVNAAAREIPKGSWWKGEHTTWPWANVWLGVSVENQHFADERIPLLLQTPAAVRFVSYEPALGPVDFRDWLKIFRNDHVVDPTGVAYNRVDLVIAGGESGQNARPSDLTWYRNAMEQCRVAGVAFFMKQLGKNPYIGRGGGPEILVQSRPNADWYPEYYPLDIDKGHGGDMVEWPEDLRVRELPR